jgi:RHS repeat-associated protein
VFFKPDEVMQPNNRNTPQGSSQKPGFQSPLNQYTQQPQQGNEDSPFYKSAAPSISLPKGGGALKGIDEKFSVNAVNGTAGMEIPLPLTPGRGGFSPALSLSYNSGGGNSEFGLGWGLSLPAIQRRTDRKLPLYNDKDESDVFLLAGAEDLIPELDEAGNRIMITSGDYTIKRYRPRIEGLFARIEYIHKRGRYDGWWRVTTRDNITTYYGLTAEGRIADPAAKQRIFKWLPQLILDHKGNVQLYQYTLENDDLIPKSLHEKNRLENGPARVTNTYLKRIRYCNKTAWTTDANNLYDPFEELPASSDFLMEAVLDYGDHSTPYDPQPDQRWSCRTDAFSDYHAGFEIRTYRTCKRVLMFHHFNELQGHDLVRCLELTYQHDEGDGTLTEADFIIAATQRGYEYSDNTWHDKALPAMAFDYEPLQWNTDMKSVAKDDFKGAPQGLTGPYQWTDFEGEGISGILTEQGNGWFYKSNLGDGHFTPPAAIATKPNFRGLGSELQWQDLDADGRRQVVSNGPVKGFWELDNDQNWEHFQPFVKNININWDSPYTKMLDLDGDGRADVLITEDRAWTWYHNEGKKGFDTGGHAPVFTNEEKGPVLLLRDKVQSIFLADMSGDGMTDLVRIKNGEICYWPNMGYGKFGAKVNMTHAPTFHHPDVYNPAYLVLADISGTGAADLIYIGKKKCTAWVNLSGNGWSAPKDIGLLPATDQLSKIAVLDFLGNGTGCIVWSSPLPQHSQSPLRYIDLMGGKKPHLMRSYNNGMGKTVSVTYKSSTQFYLADKRAGISWATRLPFPVHCISSITTHDAVSDTTYTQTYKYRHGYYDHEEREFRGFGYVETLDTDTAVSSGNDSLDQPPVLTKTWNHTGAWLREHTLLDAFKKEYFAIKDWDDLTLITDMPRKLNAQEQREAYRALKGLPLRQEVYALDGNTQLQHIPYTVTANAYAVKRVQKQGKNRYASFLSQQQQSITFSCERDPEDPRISQQLTIATDVYGNVLESVQIAYPRKKEIAGLPQKVKDEQAKMHIVFTQNTLTHDAIDVHHYRLRLPAEAKTYEVLGLEKPDGLWTLTAWADQFQNMTEIDFSDEATGAKEQRLLSHVRSLYRANSAAATPLPFRDLESLAIPHEQYQLAFTANLLQHCYDGLVTATMLGEAGYVPIDGAYWLPSGTASYADALFPDPAEQFYTPLSFKDPWGSETDITYWGDYWLLPESTKDAKDNISMVVGYDWRILQPVKMKDANNNISVIRYDTLGMPVAMAVKGKENALNPEGDSLDGLDLYDPDDIDAQQQFFAANPEDYAEALLGNATWRCVYDLGSTPVAVGMIARQHHVHNPLIVAGQSQERIVRISYSDGMGRVLMHKEQCPANTENGHKEWIGSGRTIYNNKGNAVMQFEPYFSATHLCDTAVQAANLGVSPKLFYDPLSRVYRTEMPDGTFSKTEWTAWQQITWDQNDTVIGSAWKAAIDALPATGATPQETGDIQARKQAALDAALHHDTPTVVHTDSLARPFYTIQILEAGASVMTPVEAIHSYAELDIVGNRLAVIDGNRIHTSPLIKTLQYRYNLLKQVGRQDSIDGGTGLIFIDVAGQPLYAWDASDRKFFMEYDVLRRVIRKWLNDTVLLEEMIYGEGQANDTAKNLRGQLYEHHDSAGKQWMPEGYDFKGMPVETHLCLVESKTATDINWSTPPALSAEIFITTAVVDALGRPVQMTDPGGNVTTHIYDRAGALKTVKLNGDVYVQDIHYDAKGQRTAIWYGNGTKTAYSYDPLTYRLRSLNTVRLSDNKKVQQLHYWYDPVGNITRIRDKAQATIFHDNSMILPQQTYKYDALYRLIEATGRELKGNTTGNSQDNYNDAALMTNAASPFDGNALQHYTQTYTYDAVGNILSLHHDAGVGGYTRLFGYNQASNRLHTTTVGSAPDYEYMHDVRGNMTEMPHLGMMNWNAENQLHHLTAGATEAYYQYSGGQRIRKYLEKSGAVTEERIYLGSYELYRKFVGSSLTLERKTVHINDDTGRIAMLEVKTVDTEVDLSPVSLKRFIYSNHLQSAGLELDETGAVISYEEYHPYGTTAYQAMDSTIKAAAKRYRYTGKERDEESGLNYHGARYYALWLCRWIAVDPLEGEYVGWSSYHYVKCNPINDTDSTGTKGDKDKLAHTKVTPEIAEKIHQNLLNGEPGWDPSKGKIGQTAFFTSEGNPYTGINKNQTFTMWVSIYHREDELVKFSPKDLETMQDNIKKDPAFKAEMEAKVRGWYNLKDGDPMNKTARNSLARLSKEASEQRMWVEIGNIVRESASGIGEVTLEQGPLSRQGAGKFLVVRDAERITILNDGMIFNPGLPLQQAPSVNENNALSKIDNAVKIGSRTSLLLETVNRELIILGLFYSGAKIATAKNKIETAKEEAGNWLLIGLGAQAGGTAGSVAGPVGSFVGGIVGGGIVGWNLAFPRPNFKTNFQTPNNDNLQNNIRIPARK